MYLSKIEIEGYKIFNKRFTVSLNNDLTVIVGENGTGKSAIIDSIRVLFAEDEFGRVGIGFSDFHRDLEKPSKNAGVDQIQIKGIFEKLDDIEQVAYLPWLDYSDNTKAFLNASIENKEDSYGRYKWKKWGNETNRGIFEGELVDAIRCIYLPPLRNAPEKLQAFRGSRLSRLIKNLTKEHDENQKKVIEDKVNEFNKDLLRNKDIQAIDKMLKKKVSDAVGSVFGQDTMIQFSEVNFNRIIESLKMLFYPVLLSNDGQDKYEMYRELDENSLGFNNILYLATVLAELDGLKNTDTFLKILLIEEPEAHLHPQLQSKLLHYLKTTANNYNIQVVVTTHSPTIASSVGLDSIKVLTLKSFLSQPKYCELSNCGLNENSQFFLERWLDITKSTLLFSKGILLVEGIAEALVIPELAKVVIKKYEGRFKNEIKPKTLEDFGISIINMNGIYFDHFMQLFKGYSEIDSDSKEAIKTDRINIRCAGITDKDPKKSRKPTKKKKYKGTNRCLFLIDELKEFSKKCRLFSNLKTFEYDLAIEGGNLNFLLKIISDKLETDGILRKEVDLFLAENWNKKSDSEKAEAAYWLLRRLEKNSPIGKGEFSQILAKKIVDNKFEISIPKYIEDAIKWVVNIPKKDD